MTREVLQEADVVAYLKQHPNFFEKYPELLDELVIHHQSRGALSLVDVKLQRQHQQLAQQKQDFEQLSQIAIYNEKMFFSLLPLQQELSDTDEFEQGMAILQRWSEDLGLKLGRIMLIQDAWKHSPKIAESSWLDRNAFDVIRLERFGLQRYYLGRLSNKEKSLLFLRTELPIGSVALCLLGKSLGHTPYKAVLEFASQDENHFHSQQDTAFLYQLAELLESHLERWLELA